MLILTHPMLNILQGPRQSLVQQLLMVYDSQKIGKLISTPIMSGVIDAIKKNWKVLQSEKIRRGGGKERP